MDSTHGDPRAEVARLRAAFDHLAVTLFDVDSDVDVSFVRAQPGSIAAEITTLADPLWPGFLAVQDALEALETAGPHGRDAWPELDGQIQSLQAQADAVLRRSREAASDARRSLSRLDTLTQAMTVLAATVADLGVGTIPSIDDAGRHVDALTRQLAANPLETAFVADSADRAMGAARTAVDELQRRRASLGQRLADAYAQLDELDRLMPLGAEALTETRRKIADHGELLEPVDPAVLDDGERSLRPWLANIAAEAADGAWLTADAGLEQWRQVAAGWTANARAVLATNRRPLDRRNELRGLLESIRAKAAASGRAEDPELGELHRAARDLLWTAPCDLDAAEASVRYYVEAVSTVRTVASPEDRA